MPRGGVPTLDDAVTGNYLSVTAGKEHTCALTGDGLAYCWGSNEFGQLGVAADSTQRCARDDRIVECRRAAVQVTGGLQFTKIAAGGSHTCALTADRRVFCWGDNLFGQLGDPALRQSYAPNPVLSSDAFVDIAAGRAHSCAIRTDGVMFCWGANEQGQLGIATVGLGSAAPAAAQTGQRFSSVAAGDARTCARIADGSVFCWGASWIGRSGTVEVTLPQAQPARTQQAPAFQTVTVGNFTTCGVSVDNAAFCWEANPTGSLGDGTIVGSTTPTPVRSSLRFVSISSGDRHTCAIADSGAAYCWGSNGSGQLGVSSATFDSRCGDLPCLAVPVKVSGRRLFTAISAGQGDHVCALALSGSIYCWGAGSLGQRGDGTTVTTWSPTRVLSVATPM